MNAAAGAASDARTTPPTASPIPANAAAASPRMSEPPMGVAVSPPWLRTAAATRTVSARVMIAIAARTPSPLWIIHRARLIGADMTTASRPPVSSDDQPDTRVAAARAVMSDAKLKKASWRIPDGWLKSMSG